MRVLAEGSNKAESAGEVPWLDEDDTDSNCKSAKIFLGGKTYVENIKVGENIKLVKGVGSYAAVLVE